nr:hypothetical protein [Tanacetum cinerariifolium]
MCKAYGCEPSLDLFRGFFNLFLAGSWLTFQKRSEKHIPDLLPKVITHIEGWHEQFFVVQDSIISSKYPQLLHDENMFNLKSFKDKLPPNIDKNLYFQRLGRYPTTVCVFDDPILFLAGLKPSWEFGQQRPAIIVSGKEMAFRNFIYTADDDDLSFLPKEPSPRFGTDSPSASVNTELPKDVEEPEGGSSSSPVKRKLAFGSSSSRDVRAKTSASKDDAPILSISDDDEGKFPVHLVLSEVIEKMSGGADVIKARERSRKEECEELRVKCEVAMAEFDQNHNSLDTKKAKLEAVEASLCREVEELKRDRRDVVSKVIPYVSIELVHSDELGRLVGTLVSSAITYGRCRAYEQVAAMKEPFDLSKAKGYRSSYKNEDTQANNDFSTATFPWLDEFVADAATLIEALLSKNPPTLQKLAPSRTQTHVPSS